MNFTYVQSVRGCYYVVVDKLSELGASSRCVSLHPDAHLVVINSAQEQTAVDHLLYPNLGEFSTVFVLVNTIRGQLSLSSLWDS